MSIVKSIQRNTVTLVSSLSYIDISLGIQLTNLDRSELVIDVRTGQSVSNISNMCITGRITGTNNVRIERGGNNGAVVVHFHVIEYTVASGVIVERGTGLLDIATKNIALDSRNRENSYSRVTMKTTNNSSFAAIMMTHDISSDTNLQIVGNAVDTSIFYDWQRIYMPDATVYHISGIANGVSYAVDLSGLDVVKEETFCIISMLCGLSCNIDADEFKGAHLISDSQCNIYSQFSDNHNFVLQVVHRSGNRVERNRNTFSLPSFAVNWLNPVDWDSSYINMCSPYGYFSSAGYSNNAQNFMVISQLNGDFAITLSKFTSGVISDVVSEVVYIDGNPVVAGTLKAPFWIFSNGGL